MTHYPRRGLHGAAVNLIGRRIIHGDLVPGEILDLEALEREMDVSRTVVREAVKVLAAKGMLDARPKRGTFVRPRADWSLLDPDLLRWRYEESDDPEFLGNLAEVRSIVEPAGVRLAALRRTAADLATLREALAEFTDPEETVASDLRFHRALLFATHNELLQQMEQVIEAGLRARDQLVHGQHVMDPETVQAHKAVLDAVETGDPDTAEAAMRALLSQADRDVEALVAGDGAAGASTGVTPV